MSELESCMRANSGICFGFLPLLLGGDTIDASLSDLYFRLLFSILLSAFANACTSSAVGYLYGCGGYTPPGGPPGTYTVAPGSGIWIVLLAGLIGIFPCKAACNCNI